MVTQSWFRNLWTTSKKHEFHAEKAHIAVLAFEAASLMTKLLHLWQSLNDKQVARLREEISNSVGIKKLISENDDYIGKLICAEMTENLSHVARAVARLSKKCNDPLLKSFEQAFSDLIKIGADTYGWQFSWKKMDRKIKKMERFIVTNTNLYQEMETLADLEQTLKRLKANDNADSITLVEYLKEDCMEAARGSDMYLELITLPIMWELKILENPRRRVALHYANVIIFIEKLVATPHLIGNDARDDLYNMLPASIRAALRAKLKPYAKSMMSSLYDTALAGEWNEAITATLEWLAPLAHNMLRWQSERSFEHQNLVSRTNVLLVQTLYFANQEKTEAAITELLVGLNYIWRFGREINAKNVSGVCQWRTFDEYVE
ncbi:hypothetical protein DH2020_030242 [Rehmannia glutinosa]|uniref:DUF668 domain-containing protein n=1 Tax=Rehmannia glutinosa TaxID=99300 RepID=A0ABR0VPV3_REHGL